jgi:phage/plasmid-like protein (TIGR03299 family)
LSKETALWLAQNTLTGFTDLYGKAWHFNPYLMQEHGLRPNQFPGPVPMERVEELMSFDLVSCDVIASGTFMSPEGIPVEVNTKDPRRQAIVTSDTHEVLGVFSAGYKIHPYRETTLGMLSQLVGDPMSQDLGLQVKSVGLLQNRGVVWVQVVAPAEMYAGVIEAQPFISIGTSCDGTVATIAFAGTQLIVCDNTFFAAVRAALQRIRIRHTVNSISRLDDVAEALGVMTAEQRAAASLIDMLANTPVNGRETERFFIARFGEEPADAGSKKTRWVKRNGEFMNMLATDEKVAPFAGTAFGLVQADSTYRHHKPANRTSAMPGIPLARNMYSAVRGDTWDDDAAALAAVNTMLKQSRRKQLVFA